MKHTLRWCAPGMAAVLCGCGGGGGGTDPAGGTPQAVEPSIGIFLDSPVQGLRYDTASQHGSTDAAGSFLYLPGETVTFSIGTLPLAAVPAKSVITPLDVAATTRATDQRVSNLLVLLQSLDTDANPANGIRLAVSGTSPVPGSIDLDVAPATFRSNTAVQTLLNNTLGAGHSLISEVAAQAHFQASLNAGSNGSKINIAPYAVAGSAQSVSQGALVHLDGSASSDANGDTLRYQWSLTQKPAGSSTVLSGASTATPSFVADLPGNYSAALTVSDAGLGSNTSSVAITASAVGGAPAGYLLVWADEFNSASAQLPDAGKWAYDTARNRDGWYNGELQYYASARLQNAMVQNGNLLITARQESLAGSVSDWGGQRYTSARLFTKGKASWTYGFFDIRAKLPCGAGTWPAIWSLGSSTDAWPDQGEIDIMEQTGWDKGTVLGTIHTLAGSGGSGSTGSTAVANACGSFHNYQIKWTPDAIAFYVDGVPYRTPYNKPANANGWPFDKPQYLLLNLAVGGVLGGTVNDVTLSATSLEVDYVRVYQLP